ncbi:serpin family protein [Oceanobacillus sp. CAU 1775]
MKKIFILSTFFILLLAACGTSENGTGQNFDQSTDQKDIPTLTEANNKLAFDLMDNVEADESGNIFLSPTSLYFALSLAYNGADGETKQEMDELLGFGEASKEVLNESNHALLQLLTEEKSDIELHIANSLWLDENYQFEDAFTKSVEDYYQAEIAEIDILDDKSVDTINQWVENQTNNRIKDIVEGPLDPNLVSLLINTIYFDGNWKYPFDPELTMQEQFYLENGSTKEVDMMMLSDELEYFETESFQAVSLPYGDGEMSMQLFLPNEGIIFNEELTLENWSAWQEAFQEQDGMVKLPSFELEYDTSLVEALQSLGMSQAFSEQDADFSQMVSDTDDLYISDVIQKTFLLVDEEGTEAAAATSVEMQTTSVGIDEPFMIEFNRPFFLFIKDNESDLILFIGKIATPYSE